MTLIDTDGSEVPVPAPGVDMGESSDADLPDWARRFQDEHMTLQELGDLLGITREGARQRLKKFGIASRGTAAMSAHRNEIEREARAARITSLIETHSNLRDVMAGLASDGFTRDLAIDRLVLFYPDLDSEDLLGLVEHWQVLFPNANHGETLFSDPALEAAMLYLIGSHLGLKPDPAWSAQHLDSALVGDTVEILAEANVGPSDVATVLGVIGAARRAADEGSVTITGKEYEALRSELLTALGLASAKGAAPWPPTRQTFSKRFGGWNDALIALGLSTTGRGRPKGLLRFSAEDYTSAVSDFLGECARTGLSGTFAEYGEWVQHQKAEGHAHPSGASLRSFFGSWHEVKVAAANGFAGVETVRVAGTALYTEAEYIDSLRQFLEYATATGTPAQSTTYTDWVRTEKAEGRRHPNLASAQKHFVLWNSALRAARKGTASVTSPEFFLYSPQWEVDARAQLLEGDFTLLAGSRIVTNWRPGTDPESDARKRYLEKRAELVSSRAIVDSSDGSIVTRNVIFDSSSAALLIVMGRPGVGRNEWVDEGGQSFGEWDDTVVDLEDTDSTE